MHSATVTEANAHKNHFLANVRDRVGNYADSSIFEGNSSLQRFSDGVIMNMNPAFSTRILFLAARW